MTEKTITEIAKKATEAITEQIEYELKGAWRAGLEYVHVYTDHKTQPLAHGELSDSFTIRQYTHATNQEKPVMLDGLRYRYTYDIGAADDEEIRDALNPG